MAPDALTIAHLVAPGLVGGTESVVRGLSVGHVRRGHHVHVIATVDGDPTEHPWLRELTAAGVTVHGLSVGRRAYLREYRLTRDILWATAPQVVHTHGYRPEIVGARAAQRMGIPTVTTLHGSSKVNRKTLAYEWVVFHLLRRCSAIVAVSREIERDLVRRGLPAARVHYVPNGWVPTSVPLTRDAARAELGLAREGTVVGWVGRLIPVKGCDVFLHALAEIRDLPVRAAIVGDGADREQLATLAESLDLRDRVVFCGARPAAARLFAAFDVFALSSRSEGTPITLLEAISAAVPVVATRVGAIPELVSSEEVLLAPPEDPEGLATALRAVLVDTEQASQRARAAAQRLDTSELGADAWLSAHERIYRAIIPA